VPSTYNENLRSKPKIQSLFVASMNLGDAANNNTCDPLQYLNFYANLIASTDEYVADVMEALARRGLIDDTLIIKTGDHGELGMSHGGMRQKNYNMYEETLRVPLIFSNPKLFPKPLRTSALVSHVDLAPTLAALLGTPKASLPKYGFTGRDYSSILLDPVGATPIQDYVMFT
jgi:choline-sulfatase